MRCIILRCTIWRNCVDNILFKKFQEVHLWKPRRRKYSFCQDNLVKNRRLITKKCLNSFQVFILKSLQQIKQVLFNLLSASHNVCHSISTHVFELNFSFADLLTGPTLFRDKSYCVKNKWTEIPISFWSYLTSTL